MRQLRKTVFWFLLSFLSVGSLVAQIQYGPERKWEVSLFAGHNSVRDKSMATSASGIDVFRLVTLDFNPGMLAGVRVTENRGQHFGAELEYSFANQSLALREVRPGLARVDLGQSIHSLNYSVLYYVLPRTSRLRPYASAGVGVALYHLDGNDVAAAEVEGLSLKSSWKFAGSFGGGLKYRLNERFGFRVDFRDQITGVPGYGLPKVAPSFQGNIGAGLNNQGTLHNLQFSGGMVFYIGGF